MKNRWVRLILLGLLIWIVPFVSAFAFYDSTGKLTTDYDTFKSSMIVVSSLVASYALVRYFRDISTGFIREGVLTGAGWLIINLVLDLIILVPMAKMEYKDYFTAIGLRYLQIPVFCIMTGILLEKKFTQVKIS